MLMSRFATTMKEYFMAQMEPKHNVRQKALETFYLSQFLSTPEGKKWQEKNICCIDKNQEEPDFIFNTPSNEKCGLEIVSWVNQTKQCRATQILYDIARDICRTIKERNNINLSLIIDIYNPKEWERKTREDYLKYAYNPGVKKLYANAKSIKKQFLDIIIATSYLTEYPRQQWISINGQHFKLSFCRSWAEYPEFFVNNMGFCWDDPMQAIQNIISEKNKKYDSYIKNCKICSLLIISPLYNTGNSLITPKMIAAHHFTSKFKDTYVLELHDSNSPHAHKLLVSYS